MTKLEWTLSDRTTVTSDGVKITVHGRSEFAKRLRRRLADHETNEHPIEVAEFPEPDSTPLAPSRARNVNAWVEREVWRNNMPRILGRRRPVSVTSRPEIEYPPSDDDYSGLPPGVQRVH